MQTGPSQSVAADLDLARLTLPAGPDSTHIEIPRAYVLLFDMDAPANLLLRQGKSGRYGFPGGNLLNNEDPVSGAIREVLEEVGLNPDPESLVYICSKQLRVFEQTWKRTKVEAHGYPIGDELANQKGIRVDSPWQIFFAAPIDRQQAPRVYDGRRYKFFNVQQSCDNERLQPRFASIFSLWSEQLRAEQN